MQPMLAPTETILKQICNEAEIRFVRASGPGGQNVNKVATAAQLSFDIAACGSLSEAAKLRLRKLGGRRVSGEGVLMIDAQRFRTQEANRKDALGRLEALIGQAMVAPKARVATRPTAGARRRRIEGKRARSALKIQRKGVGGDE
jgi:ribosome-associated protein